MFRRQSQEVDVPVIANRERLLAALGGRRPDTLTHCPHCGNAARFSYGRGDDGHEVAGWIFEKPILVCPDVPADRFISASGSLITIAVHERHNAEQQNPSAEAAFRDGPELRAASGS
jgi:hypothetical protein